MAQDLRNGSYGSSVTSTKPDSPASFTSLGLASALEYIRACEPQLAEPGFLASSFNNGDSRKDRRRYWRLLWLGTPRPRPSPDAADRHQGFEAVKQLLEQSQPYRVILGARDTKTANAAFGKLQFDRAANAVTVLPLDLADLKGVKTFAQQVLQKLGQEKVDYLLMNAGMIKGTDVAGLHGSRWCETVIVNHFCEYLIRGLLSWLLTEP